MNNLNCQQTNEPALLQQKYQKKTIDISIKDLIVGRQEKLREHTRMVDLSLLKNLEEFSKKTTLNVKSIDTDFCYKFANYLVNKTDIKISTATTYMQKLHAVLQEAVYSGYIECNPMPPIKRLLPKYISHQKANLSIHEVELLNKYDCPHLITKMAFLFSCYTGLRLSDIETLQWNNIQKRNGIYMLNKIQVKTNTEVSIPLCRHALLILKAISKNCFASDLRNFAKKISTFF